MAFLELTAPGFEKKLAAQKSPVLVIVYAGFCAVCNWMEPIFEQALTDFGAEVLLSYVDVERQPAIAQHFATKATPSIYFYKDGEVKSSRVGSMTYDQLFDYLDECLA